MVEKKRGRPSSITVKVDKHELSVTKKEVEQVLKTKVREFSKSGGYIPLSQEYCDHEAFVIVLKK